MENPIEEVWYKTWRGWFLLQLATLALTLISMKLFCLPFEVFGVHVAFTSIYFGAWYIVEKTKIEKENAELKRKSRRDG